MKTATTSAAGRRGLVAFAVLLTSGLCGCSSGYSVTFSDPRPVDSPATPGTPTRPASVRATVPATRPGAAASSASSSVGTARIVTGSPQDRLQASLAAGVAQGSEQAAVARVVRSYLALTTRWNHEGRAGSAAELDAVASGAASREVLRVNPGQRMVGTAAVRVTSIEVDGADALVRACGDYDLRVIDRSGSVVQELETITGFRIEAASIAAVWKITSWVEVADDTCR